MTSPIMTGGRMTYRAHSQNIGWQSDVAAGETAGREGLRMEAFQINAAVDNLPESAARIDYRAHVQNVGWQGWKRDGQNAGTTGKGYRVEDIEIKPSIQMARAYDVYYRVKIAHFGWLDWAKNGQSAGSTGMSFQIEAMQAVLVPKGSEAPAPIRNQAEPAPYGAGYCRKREGDEASDGIGSLASRDSIRRNGAVSFGDGSPYEVRDNRPRFNR